MLLFKPKLKKRQVHKRTNAKVAEDCPVALGRAYERGYKRYSVLGHGTMKVRTLCFSVIKPKITSVSQLPG